MTLVQRPVINGATAPRLYTRTMTGVSPMTTKGRKTVPSCLDMGVGLTDTAQLF